MSRPPRIERIKEYLENNPGRHTANEIATALNLTTAEVFQLCHKHQGEIKFCFDANSYYYPYAYELRKDSERL